MKPFLLLVFLSLQSLLLAQITFEKIATPKDFNIGAVRQSPTGEFFIQASNDPLSLYTSMDGQVWTNTSLPFEQDLNEIGFFSDGTPVLKPFNEDHLIRRNGSWYAMHVSGGFQNVQASFIKDDTLFVYQDNIFAYSLDKGQSFTSIFTYSESIPDHTADLWKYDNYFILHHGEVGHGNNISVFNKQGQRVLFEKMELYIQTMTYTACGGILFADYNRYYLFEIQGLILTSGEVNDIFPGFSFSTDLYAVDDDYYLREGNSIYKTSGCNFIWEQVESNDWIRDNDHFWVNDLGDLFLYNNRSDFFSVKAYGSNVWEDHAAYIDYASVLSINEAGQSHQMTLTPNALFTKNNNETDWTELDSLADNNYQIKYAPGGSLYINRGTDIFYSTDNGQSFDTIQFPDLEIDPGVYSMEVVSDGKLLIQDLILETSYYTLDNGLTWVPVNVPSASGVIMVKLVENYIITVTYDFDYVVTLINISNGESTSTVIGDFVNVDFYETVIQDDGTIYFHGLNVIENDPEGLYRYRIGEGLEFIGHFDELLYSYLLTSSGNDLFCFGDAEYYLLNEGALEAFEYIGLPTEGSKEFYKAENEYLYVVIDRHAIYRSTQPLASPQHISGTIYHDSNKDCATDTTDATLQYWQVKVESEQYVRIKTSDFKGHFDFAVPKGEYTLSSHPINTSWDVCEPVFNITIDENTASVNQDFLAIGLRDCADLELDFSTPLLRRCFDNFYSVRVRNTGPEATVGTILTMELDPFFEFKSATIPFTLVGDSIVKFDLGILAVNDEISFKIFFKISCDAVLGTEHCMTGILTDDNICGGERSDYTECQENIGSYDPNDKRVFNEAGDEAERIDKGEYIYYHIRFQNTGTDTAFNIRVVDPLSPKLDLSTLEMLSASQSL